MQLSVYPNGVLNSGTGACYEFDPSTLKWNVNVCHDYVQANCEYYAPDNETLCIDGQSTRLHTLYTISDDGKETNCGPLRGATQSGRWSHFIRDTDTGDLYDISYNVIAAITPDGCFTTSETDAVLPTSDALGFPVDFPFIGAASGHDGYLYMWQGDEKIIRYNTTTRRFDVIWNEAYKDTGPFTSEEAGLNKILGKWVYFPAEGVFAGIADGDPAHTRAGWWLWKPGPN